MLKIYVTPPASAPAGARTGINCPPSIAVAMATGGGGPGC